MSLLPAALLSIVPCTACSGSPHNATHSASNCDLRRDVNKAFARVTGGKVNRGAGYGLEIPCVYQFYGPKPYWGEPERAPH